jgi:AraC family transcriptional regulator, arabinose operon regulatory protein
MKLMNYMNLNQHPVQLSFLKDRSHEFQEIYHAHQGMEFLYVHEGQGHVVVERQIFELGPGSFFYFRPYQLHRVRISGLPKQPYIRSLFVFEPSVLEEVLQAFPALQSFLRMLYKDPSSLQNLSNLGLTDMDAWITSHSLSLRQCPPEHLLEERLFFLSSLLHRIRAGWTSSEAMGWQAPRRAVTVAERMMEWLEEHYMEPFELSRLAHAVHLTPNHVSSLFRKSVGSSITEYITARRIRQACWLLQTTELPVKDIGETVGYPNFSYFCQAFKRHVGQSPYQFKQQV